MSTPLTNEIETPLAVLQRARTFIQRGWCKHTLAKTANGEGRQSDAPDAVRWCAIGAIGAALGVGHPWDTRIAATCAKALTTQVPYPRYGIVNFNNDSRTTKKAMLKVFDRAIESQRGYGFAAFRAASLSALEQTHAK